MGNNKKGMAMIAALMTAFIFLALVSTLCLLATSGTRQANYAKKATIALHLAEAGIADALYRLNYCSSGDYPFDNVNSKTPFDGTAIASLPYERSFDEGGTYKIDFTDSTSANQDKITSTGTYKGTKRKLSVLIRGDNDAVIPADRQALTQGIPEAFNKHVIYADRITALAGATPTIEGNLCAVNMSLALGATGQYTATKVNSSLFDPPSISAPSDISPPGDPASWNKIFKDDELANSGYQNSMPGNYVPTGGLPAGVNYSAPTGSETYTLDAAAIGTECWLFEGVSTDTPLDIKVEGTTSMASGGFLKVKRAAVADPAGKGDITLDFSGANNPDLAGDTIRADGDIAIVSGATPNPIGKDSNTETILYAGGEITIPQNFTIRGNVAAEGTLILNGPKVKGSILSKSDISLATAVSAIYGSSSKEAAIILKTDSTTDHRTLTISISPKIYLDNGNEAVIIAYSTGDHDITIDINNDIGYPKSTDGSTILYSKSGIIAYTEDSVVGGNTSINVGNNVNVNGLLYVSSSNSSATCKIAIDNTGATEGVKGVIIAQDEVELKNGAIVSWDSIPFKFCASSIYEGFTAGRRVYLPVLGSWRLE